MEALGLLEGKIKNLVDLVGKLRIENAKLLESSKLGLDENFKLKSENSRLVDENVQLLQKVGFLQSQIESFEGSICQNSKNLDELSQEKELTKMVVDDLIKSIDSLVEENQQ